MAGLLLKRDITKRFVALTKYLLISGTVKSKTEIGTLIGQPLQVVSKLLTGQRIITLEQMKNLISNTAIDSHWFLTGKGEMIRYSSAIIQESQTEYSSTNNPSKTVAAILPLVSELEEKFGLLKKENDKVKSQLEQLQTTVRKKSTHQ